MVHLILRFCAICSNAAIRYIQTPTNRVRRSYSLKAKLSEKQGIFFALKLKKQKRYRRTLPTKRPVTQCPVTKIQLPNVQLQNVHLPNVQLQNVQVRKRPRYQTSIFIVITERVEDEGRELQQGLPVGGGQPGLTHQEQDGHALHLVKEKKEELECRR